jgi:hypothetical protein
LASEIWRQCGVLATIDTAPRAPRARPPADGAGGRLRRAHPGAPGIPLLEAGPVVAGAAVSPMLIVQLDLIRTAAPLDVAIEAFPWRRA